MDEFDDLVNRAKHDANKDFFQPGHDTAEDYDLAKCHMREGNFEKAKIYLERELRKTPDSPDALWRYAKCLEETGQYDEALKSYVNALASCQEKCGRVDDDILGKLVGCLKKMYNYEDSNEKDFLALDKIRYAVIDRVHKGEDGLAALLDSLG